ncbi:hypothetical protein HDU92_001250 [Lobulomyces angularis]|nr:hypothetical protein HDU92_001250 [Lobulomyces angularis]
MLMYCSSSDNENREYLFNMIPEIQIENNQSNKFLNSNGYEDSQIARLNPVDSNNLLKFLNKKNKNHLEKFDSEITLKDENKSYIICYFGFEGKSDVDVKYFTFSLIFCVVYNFIIVFDKFYLNGYFGTEIFVLVAFNLFNIIQLGLGLFNKFKEKKTFNSKLPKKGNTNASTNLCFCLVPLGVLIWMSTQITERYYESGLSRLISKESWKVYDEETGDNKLKLINSKVNLTHQQKALLDATVMFSRSTLISTFILILVDGYYTPIAIASIFYALHSRLQILKKVPKIAGFVLFWIISLIILMIIIVLLQLPFFLKISQRHVTGKNMFNAINNFENISNTLEINSKFYINLDDYAGDLKYLMHEISDRDGILILNTGASVSKLEQEALQLCKNSTVIPLLVIASDNFENLFSLSAKFKNLVVAYDEDTKIVQTLIDVNFNSWQYSTVNILSQFSLILNPFLPISSNNREKMIIMSVSDPKYSFSWGSSKMKEYFQLYALRIGASAVISDVPQQFSIVDNAFDENLNFRETQNFNSNLTINNGEVRASDILATSLPLTLLIFFISFIFMITKSNQHRNKKKLNNEKEKTIHDQAKKIVLNYQGSLCGAICSLEILSISGWLMFIIGEFLYKPKIEQFFDFSFTLLGASSSMFGIGVAYMRTSKFHTIIVGCYTMLTFISISCCGYIVMVTTANRLLYAGVAVFLLAKFLSIGMQNFRFCKISEDQTKFWIFFGGLAISYHEMEFQAKVEFQIEVLLKCEEDRIKLKQDMNGPLLFKNMDLDEKLFNGLSEGDNIWIIFKTLCCISLIFWTIFVAGLATLPTNCPMELLVYGCTL